MKRHINYILVPLLIVLLVFFSYSVATRSASAAPQWVQGLFVVGGAGSPQTVQFTAPVAQGDIIVANSFYKLTGCTVTVTDSGGNTYYDSGNGSVARPIDGFIQTWFANVTGGAGTQITLTFTYSGCTPLSGRESYFVSEYSGIAQQSSSDAHASGTAANVITTTTGNFTTTNANDILFYFAISDVNQTTVQTCGGLAMNVRRDVFGSGTSVGDLDVSSIQTAQTCSITWDTTPTRSVLLMMALKASAHAGVSIINGSRVYIRSKVTIL